MLIDTSGLLCLLHAAEPQHHDAVTFFNIAPVKLTSSYILAEFIVKEALTTDHHFEQAGFVRLLTP